MSAETEALVRNVLKLCRARGAMLATAESCTGGMIAAALTATAGSSDVFDRGFVTYSNDAKVALLGVDGGTLAHHGAVSQPVALEMAQGALNRSHAAIAVSVTGIAGPGGASAEKPVGLVWFGLAQRDREPVAEQRIFAGFDRGGVRAAACRHALTMISQALEDG